MVIVCIDEIVFKLDKDRHTMNYVESCRKMEQKRSSDGINRFKWAAGDSRHKAIQSLAKQIRQEFQVYRSNAPKVEDFVFSIRESETDAEGTFWAEPPSVIGKYYSVESGLPLKDFKKAIAC